MGPLYEQRRGEVTEFEAFIAAIDRQLAQFPNKLVGAVPIATKNAMELVREAAKHAIEDSANSGDEKHG